MNEQRYTALAVMLTIVAGTPTALDGLDDSKIENLMFLLQGALIAVARENGRRQEPAEKQS